MWNTLIFSFDACCAYQYKLNYYSVCKMIFGMNISWFSYSSSNGDGCSNNGSLKSNNEFWSTSCSLILCAIEIIRGGMIGLRCNWELYRTFRNKFLSFIKYYCRVMADEPMLILLQSPSHQLYALAFTTSSIYCVTSLSCTPTIKVQNCSKELFHRVKKYKCFRSYGKK